MQSQTQTQTQTHQRTTPNRPKIGFVSLGCPKALVDSERIITQLKLNGYEISPSYEHANAVIVNTCGFIDAAKAESLEAIGEAISSNGKVIVTGCLGKDQQAIRDIHPQVLSVSGPQAFETVMAAVHEAVPPPCDQETHDPFISLVPEQGIKLTPKHYAYLKISEGCNQSCSFCIIPAFRGKLASRPAGDVMQEAEQLVRGGVKELLIISQDTGAYGADLKYPLSFWGGRPVKTRIMELCEALGQLGVWVRLHYLYPYPHLDQLMPLMQSGAILPYLDIPLQHASHTVLKAMRRPAAAENTLRRIEQWRAECPELVLRSTFIVGFPGETEQDFEQLLQFLQAAQLDRVGCFQYSPVEGAKANDLPNPVAEEIKQARFDRLMTLQQQISSAKLQQRVGSEVDVVIDAVEENWVVTRSYAEAPEIDGVILVERNESKSFDERAIGQRRRVKITDADHYDLFAQGL